MTLDLGVGFVVQSVLPIVVGITQLDLRVCEQEFRPDLVRESYLFGAEVLEVVRLKFSREHFVFNC